MQTAHEGRPNLGEQLRDSIEEVGMDSTCWLHGQRAGQACHHRKMEISEKTP